MATFQCSGNPGRAYRRRPPRGRMRNDDSMNGTRSNRSVTGGQSPSLERRVAAVGLGGLATFQLALAAGAPWGRASYGGAHPGVLPHGLRLVSAGAALFYSGLTVAVASQRTPVQARRQILTGIATLMSVGAVVNGISPSWPERAIWTPTAALLALSAWRARGDH